MTNFDYMRYHSSIVKIGISLFLFAPNLALAQGSENAIAASVYMSMIVGILIMLAVIWLVRKLTHTLRNNQLNDVFVIPPTDEAQAIAKHSDSTGNRVSNEEGGTRRFFGKLILLVLTLIMAAMVVTMFFQ